MFHLLFIETINEYNPNQINMNNSKIKFLFYSIGLFFLLIGCEDKITEERIYTANVPVYMSYDELRSAVQVQSPIELENPGKMYFKDNYIFISEQLAGVHIIDNSNPSAPQNVAFINIPGNTEVAVFGNYLYVDSYVDLVVMDISSPGNATEVKRIENIFPYSTPSPDSDYPVAQLEPIKGVVTSWKIEEINETTEHTVSHFYYYEAYDMAVARETSGMSNQNTVVPNNSGSSTGIAGSMSRFIISKEHLYTVEESTMHVFDLANPNNPAEGTTIDITNLDWNSIVETIFPYNDYIFVGTQSGMLVYDISIPGTPVFTSEFSHITSCDPVVVENDTAYVTLRGGSACGSFNNQLDVIDVSNISS
ncbi:MAG: hypothetical protein C0594_11580, partial [Marinilabiliales bacterium]